MNGNDNIVDDWYPQNSIISNARQEAVEELEGRRESEEISRSLKLRKGACEPAREHIRRSRKPRMRTVEHFLCDHCDCQIPKPEDGFVVHGNIYVADPNKAGGLIGNNFPECDEPVTQDKVTKTVMCRQCFMKALGLFDYTNQGGFTRRRNVTEF
jgi:hypothetical protein